MIRNKIFNEYGIETNFRLRGKEVGRLEALSDGVFSLAIGLLVVSSQVPVSFRELLSFMEDFPAFFLCIVMIVRIWRLHYGFFLRFGLRDNFCISLNAFLLFLLLFYIYPLKFLFKFVIKWVYLEIRLRLTFDKAHLAEYRRLFTQIIEPQQLPVLTLIYGTGLTLIFCCFAMLYAHAYRKKAVLELTSFETSETLHSRNILWIITGVSLLSSLVAITGLVIGQPFFSFWSGITFLLIPICTRLYARFWKK